ncbi:hypothetical protein GWI33_011933 [Rhynchophorus ferrugineus]|uniref:Uncharacterized protein n=1 Tax=Rhynchophorus ferrugineus TaxID=354439 RepID=A0A834IU58_RHYFE|nr:hypothetical protein GWI33_011933 [Rhynchophorus ferrugineus]
MIDITGVKKSWTTHGASEGHGMPPERPMINEMFYKTSVSESVVLPSTSPSTSYGVDFPARKTEQKLVAKIDGN